MLILTRRLGETIVIGQGELLTGVTVLQVTAGGVPLTGVQVKLGINAPAEVSVDREEVRNRKDAGVPHTPKTLALPRSKE